MKGEVDFSRGTQSRSYEFVANLVRPAQGVSQEIVKKRQEDDVDREVKSSEDLSVKKAATVSFQHGFHGYNATVDVEIWAIAPDKPLERQGTLTSDGNNGGGESQVLMRFDKVFGLGPGKIPHHARIKSATLNVVAFDPGTTVYVHRMFVPWGSAATWNSLAAGVSIDNIEASTVRDGFTFGQINMDRQSVEFDVTQTVQHWSDGEANFGWVFVNTGSNGWDFYSADWHEKELRPTLTVQYELRDSSDAQRSNLSP